MSEELCTGLPAPAVEHVFGVRATRPTRIQMVVQLMLDQGMSREAIKYTGFDPVHGEHTLWVFGKPYGVSEAALKPDGACVEAAAFLRRRVGTSAL